MSKRSVHARPDLPGRGRPGRSAHPVSGPWVIDTRDVGRRPGSMKAYQRQAPVAGGIGYRSVIEVPDGAEVELDLRAESVVEGVLVSGTATAPTAGECSRCLDQLADTVTVQLTELFAYPDSDTALDADSAESAGVSLINNDLVDVEPVVRDAMMLALPQAPLCRPDCPGLCPECGARRAELGPDHTHETIDPRWAALADRLGEVDDTSEES